MKSEKAHKFQMNRINVEWLHCEQYRKDTSFLDDFVIK